MKWKLFIMLLNSHLFVFGQLSINEKLRTDFQNSKNVFPKALKEYFVKDRPSLALFTLYQIDTLNLHEIKLPNYSNINISEINGKPYNENSLNIDVQLRLSKKDIFRTSAHFLEDTLLIDIGFPYSPEHIKHKVYKNTYEVTYEEDYGTDLMLKLNKNDSLLSKITIPIKIIQFELSSLNYKIGDKIYGHCKFDTVPYFFVGRYIDEGILNIKKSFDYYFEAIIQK